jgi:hypothetical protein
MSTIPVGKQIVTMPHPLNAMTKVNGLSLNPLIAIAGLAPEDRPWLKVFPGSGTLGCQLHG